uniref:Uncharacterized protein n=1 Tax=Anguilla anguilla TaxID=7936 RepID=A0A0E9QIE5_ANGAN
MLSKHWHHLPLQYKDFGGLHYKFVFCFTLHENDYRSALSNCNSFEKHIIRQHHC